MSVTDMDALDIAEFLESQHTGVLSLSSDGDAYAIPLSYAYDESGPYVYFRLGYAPGSQKRRYIDATDHVSFVVYDETDEGWKSVVARGPLEEVSDSGADASVVEAVRDLDIPYFAVHDRPANELELTVARIDVGELSGIVEGDRHG